MTAIKALFVWIWRWLQALEEAGGWSEAELLRGRLSDLEERVAQVEGRGDGGAAKS